MDITKRKAAWLTNEYSRTSGSILRKAKRLKVLQAKEARYLHLASLVTKQIASTEKELEEHKERAKTLAQVIELHDGGVPVADAYVIRPHVRARVLGHGGLTRAIYRAFGRDLDQVLTLDELQDAIVADTDTPEENVRLLRDRLVVRINTLRALGKLTSLDPPLARRCRWKLASEFVPEYPKQEPWGKPSRGEAGVQSASWLIKSAADPRVFSEGSGRSITNDGEVSDRAGKDLGRTSSCI